MLDTIVAALLPDRPDIAPAQRRAAGEAAARFVRDALKRAPLHLRLAERLARTAIFLALSPAAPALRYERPAGGYARTVISAFEHATGASANVIRLYRSLSIFAFYEHESLVSHLGSTPAAQRQDVFRAAFAAEPSKG